MYYECKKPWHFKIDFPLLKKIKKKKIKKKIMMASQGNGEDSNSDEEMYKVTNLCLMAYKKR